MNFLLDNNLLGVSSPGESSGLHVVGQRHVVRPHVVLPFLQTDHAAEHVARVNADAHADVDLRGLLQVTAEERESVKTGLHNRGNVQTDLMAEHMSNPIWTQFLACVAMGSGRPDTQ